MVPFGGWEMPVQFRGIIEEHNAVRTKSGVFDISHMGEFFVSADSPEKVDACLNRLLTNDVSRLKVGQGQYSFLLNEQGGVVDDLILYRQSPNTFFVVVNASKIDEDFARLTALSDAGVEWSNRSGEFSAVALQGPESVDIYRKAFGKDAPMPSRFELSLLAWREQTILVARTGYTGEDGVELFFPHSLARPVWSLLLEKGAMPIGLGARDTLRMEACYPLNGNDLDATTTPLEAGMSFAVAINKPDFVGKNALTVQIAAGLSRKLVAFSIEGKGAPPRSHYQLFLGTQKVGEVTSGTFSPSLQKGIGLGYVSAHASAPGTVLDMEVRGQRVPIVIKPKPLYKGHSL